MANLEKFSQSGGRLLGGYIMLFFVLLLLLLLSAEGTCQVRSTANSLHAIETDHPIKRRRSSVKEPEKPAWSSTSKQELQLFHQLFGSKGPSKNQKTFNHEKTNVTRCCFITA